ncbi:collagen alpha-1(VII) chain-like [Chrysemys picta bellii]|uniref:collagen alpha-1(VII) chain-like n=1 Tax=Chrysemys picta bellii TaxID=8478 RepID=UPI0032B25E8F
MQEAELSDAIEGLVGTAASSIPIGPEPAALRPSSRWTQGVSHEGHPWHSAGKGVAGQGGAGASCVQPQETPCSEPGALPAWELPQRETGALQPHERSRLEAPGPPQRGQRLIPAQNELHTLQPQEAPQTAPEAQERGEPETRQPRGSPPTALRGLQREPEALKSQDQGEPRAQEPQGHPHGEQGPRQAQGTPQGDPAALEPPEQREPLVFQPRQLVGLDPPESPHRQLETRQAPGRLQREPGAPESLGVPQPQGVLLREPQGQQVPRARRLRGAPQSELSAPQGWREAQASQLHREPQGPAPQEVRGPPDPLQPQGSLQREQGRAQEGREPAGPVHQGLRVAEPLLPWNTPQSEPEPWGTQGVQLMEPSRAPRPQGAVLRDPPGDHTQGPRELKPAPLLGPGSVQTLGTLHREELPAPQLQPTLLGEAPRLKLGPLQAQGHLQGDSEVIRPRELGRPQVPQLHETLLGPLQPRESQLLQELKGQEAPQVPELKGWGPGACQPQGALLTETLGPRELGGPQVPLPQALIGPEAAQPWGAPLDPREPETEEPRRSPQGEPECEEPRVSRQWEPECEGPRVYPQREPEREEPRGSPQGEPEREEPRMSPQWEPECEEPRRSPQGEPECEGPRGSPQGEPETEEPRMSPQREPETEEPWVSPQREPECEEPRMSPQREPETEGPRGSPQREPEGEEPRGSPQREPETEEPRVSLQRKPDHEGPQGPPQREPETEEPRGSLQQEPECEEPRVSPQRKPDREGPQGSLQREPETKEPRVSPQREPETEGPRGSPQREPETEGPRRSPQREPEGEEPRGSPQREPETEEPRVSLQRKPDHEGPQGPPQREPETEEPRGSLQQEPECEEPRVSLQRKLDHKGPQGAPQWEPETEGPRGSQQREPETEGPRGSQQRELEREGPRGSRQRELEALEPLERRELAAQGARGPVTLQLRDTLRRAPAALLPCGVLPRDPGAAESVEMKEPEVAEPLEELEAAEPQGPAPMALEPWRGQGTLQREPADCGPQELQAQRARHGNQGVFQPQEPVQWGGEALPAQGAAQRGPQARQLLEPAEATGPSPPSLGRPGQSPRDTPAWDQAALGAGGCGASPGWGAQHGERGGEAMGHCWPGLPAPWGRLRGSPLRREKAFIRPSRREQQEAVCRLAELQLEGGRRHRRDKERQLLRFQERLSIARHRSVETLPGRPQTPAEPQLQARARLLPKGGPARHGAGGRCSAGGGRRDPTQHGGQGKAVARGDDGGWNPARRGSNRRLLPLGWDPARHGGQGAGHRCTSRVGTSLGGAGAAGTGQGAAWGSRRWPAPLPRALWGSAPPCLRPLAGRRSAPTGGRQCLGGRLGGAGARGQPGQHWLSMAGSPGRRPGRSRGRR